MKEYAMENSVSQTKNSFSEILLSKQMSVVTSAIARLEELDHEDYAGPREVVGLEYGILKELPSVLSSLERLRKELQIIIDHHKLLKTTQEISDKSEEVVGIQERIERMRESLLVR